MHLRCGRLSVATAIIVFMSDAAHSVTTKHTPSTMNSAAPSTPRAKIAVIGAGAAGLAAARVVSRGNDIGDGDATTSLTVLEKDMEVGGVWQHHAHSSTRPMYRGLRTNLPKEVMQYREMAWTSPEDVSFLPHNKVAEYLETYTTTFDLTPYISFGSTVLQLTVLPVEEHTSALSPETERWPKIRLEWQTRPGDNSSSSSSSSSSEIFDAIFVCNGHYGKASCPEIPGINEYYRGRTMHSVAYDEPSIFQDQVVLCIGGRASGADLAREISFHAKHVYLSDTTCSAPIENSDGGTKTCPVMWVPKTVAVRSDGSLEFEGCDDLSPKVDTIIYCSGYDYSFPFINEKSNLELNAVPGERRVSPLYLQLWHARYPNLAFVGLPHSVVPFPLMELQAESTCAQWQPHRFQLPPIEERLQQAFVDARKGGAKMNGRVQDTHYLGDAQWEYSRQLAKLAGIYNDEIEAYITVNKDIYDAAGQARKDLIPGGPDSYRSLIFERNQEKNAFDVRMSDGGESEPALESNGSMAQ